MSEDKKKKILCSATIHWCYNNKKSVMSDKYEVTLGNLSDAAVAALTEMGLTVHNRPDKPELGRYIVGKSQYPIKTYYNNEELDATTLVGNGSKGVAAVSKYEWNARGKKGYSASVAYLDITELVEYTSNKEPQEVL